MSGSRLARIRRLTMSARWAHRSDLSAKYWKRLPLLTPASRAMTFRLPLENPCAPNSASAAASTARRRSSGSRSQVAVGMSPLARRSSSSYYDHRSYDQWSHQGEGVLTERVKIVIIGAGFAGLGMGIRLKQAGENDFVIL